MSLVNAIGSSLTAVTPLSGTSSANSTGDFSSVLKNAVQQVNGYQQQATQDVNQFLQGSGELHNVALSAQRAEMVFDLAVQVRNKVVSAYQEIMKMQL
ncbi:MAG TPA: flagellar hook-basal body complex protein FliE [Bryobacteraceae bacterium]|jgi:flagellar hook-basal body complex protein FliE|nr:flagellar hook-basal body complex protein FliE [Bryobacteraceae bacterium]